VFPHVKIQRIQICWAWRLCRESSSAYPLVMIGVAEDISHSMAKMWWNIIMHYFSYNSQIKCFQTHVGMEIFPALLCETHFQNLSANFSYTLYRWNLWSSCQPILQPLSNLMYIPMIHYPSSRAFHSKNLD
jgi:hypothetical protein